MSKGPRTLGERRPDILRRVEANLTDGADGCKLWTGLVQDGTPRFYFNGKVPARRIALQLVGRRLNARVVRFTTTCNTPLCVAAEHAVPIYAARHKRHPHRLLD